MTTDARRTQRSSLMTVTEPCTKKVEICPTSVHEDVEPTLQIEDDRGNEADENEASCANIEPSSVPDLSANDLQPDGQIDIESISSNESVHREEMELSTLQNDYSNDDNNSSQLTIKLQKMEKM